MVQRVQTVWLFFASLAIFCLFLFPYLHVLSANGTAKALKVTGVYENINGEVVHTSMFLPLIIITVILGLIPLVIIFFYQNRKTQIQICYFNIVAILAFSFWLVQVAKQVFGDITLQIGNYGIGVILPSLAILFTILALRGIRNDEKLIKSADRLR
ncbi:MAG: DUF4293 domain-containing protein [Daejeonella sp.]